MTRRQLDQIYRRYNRRKYVSPDPLQFLYDYPDIQDREIAGLIASCFAYGRVAGILSSVSRILNFMGPSPREFLRECTEKTLLETYDGFRHRFATHRELIALLLGISGLFRKYGSLNECFLAFSRNKDSTVMPALQGFVDATGCAGNHLLPSPSKGSACKRLNLFLRWMVRKDAVDPGGWQGIDRNKLVIPLDVHMSRIALRMGLTERKSCGIRTALEITEAFRNINASDPVKYDFALTRFGIRNDLAEPRFLRAPAG